MQKKDLARIFQYTPSVLNNMYLHWRNRKYKEFPSLLLLEATNKCNAKCIMCPTGEGLLTRPRGTMTMELFKKCIDEAKNYPMKRILLHLDGEPVIDQNLAEKVRYVRTHMPNTEIGFSTNVSLWTEKKAEEIFKADVSFMILSVDGATKATYEKIRGLKYETTVKNLKMLIETKQRVGAKSRLIIQMVKQKLNASEAEALEEQWGKYPGVEVKIKNAHNFVDLNVDLNKRSTRLKPCGKIFRTMTVYWNGEVPICCLDYNGELIIGNATRQSLGEIWNGETLKAVRQIHLQRKGLPALKPCNRCSEIRKEIPTWL